MLVAKEILHHLTLLQSKNYQGIKDHIYGYKKIRDYSFL